MTPPNAHLAARARFAALPAPLRDRFCALAAQLSPENLSCDGELSRAQVRARTARIRAEWRALEQQAGQSVSVDAAETYGIGEAMRASEAYRRQREAARNA